MKKWLIGSLVGAIIVFGWQFLSWTVLPVHSGFGHYTPNQENIMSTLSSSLTEEGHYIIPTVPRGSSMDEMEAMGKKMDGQPWAMVIYDKAYEYDMAMPMIRGFLVDLVLVFLLIYILTRAGTPPPIRIIAGSVAVGLFCWLWGPYMGHNWYHLPMDMIIGDLVDGIVAWGICGIWLGWWLNR